MKSTCMLYALTALLLTACHAKEYKVKQFVPGTYVTEWKNEFSESRDTISIAAPSDRQTDIYLVTKRSYYRQTVDGKQMKPQYKVQHWTGTYNPEVNTIVINKTGRRLSFNPDKNILVEGTTTYAKIK